MFSCQLCPNRCGVDRELTVGACSVSNKLKIAKYGLFHYEEPVISGDKGSGAIFFCGCSLKCVFCQNYELSRNQTGKEITTLELVEIFKELEKMGAHNVNLVNPSHYVFQIKEALEIYKPKIPIVWNSHGYELTQTLKLIDDLVDIYLVDLKYYSPKVSLRYSGKENYFEVAKNAVDFMQNTKKTVLYNGLMKQGVIIRHLILPLNTNDSISILSHLKSTIKNGSFLSLMAQYTPYGDVEKFSELKRPITKREYEKVLSHLYSLNFENVFIQERQASSTAFIPKWDY